MDLKKRADRSAVAKGLLEEDQEDTRVLYVALTRAASRCVLYHAPVAINENKETGALKIPALTRILRSQSWCGEKELSEEEWKQNRIASQMGLWIEQEQLDEYVSFSTFDADGSPSVVDWQKTETSRLN